MQSATSISISIGDSPESSGSSPAKLPTVTLTPSATIRNRYYQRYREGRSPASSTATGATPHQHKEKIGHGEDDEDDVLSEANVGWPMTSYYAPLKSPVDSPKSIRSFMSSEEAGSVMSLRTEIFGTDDSYSLSSQKTTDSNHIFHYKAGAAKTSRSNTLFRSKTGAEPKIELDHHQQQQQGHHELKRSKSRGPTTLLSRLSKTTAPMRAKLSAMSRSGSSFNLRSNDYTPTPLRRSAESMLNMPVTPRKTVMRHKGERSQSFSHGGLLDQETKMKVLKVHETFQNQKYPALLSQVAQMLQERVTVETKIKDSIEYKDAFDGKHAVDKLCLFIGKNDRNIALLLGRTLDAQKFFHDVNYEHRLRDSSHELYQFKQHINYGQKHRLASSGEQDDDDEEDEKSEFNFMDNHVGGIEKDADRLPNGVFTPLTTCYSPTCTRDNLCYSIFCPQRVEQQQAKEKTLHRSGSKSSLIDKEDDRLWINTVPKQIVSKLSSAEKKRQENIFELIYTERDFVNDLVYVIKYWIGPLLETDVVPEEYREALVRDLFWNIKEVYAVNSLLADALDERQKTSPVVEQIGDIMLQHVAFFGPFVQYGAHQMVARYVLETEKATDQAFLAFVEATERLPQSRKLELNAYLTKPTTRLGRYNLLLREILKHTPDGHPDRELIPKAMKVISEFLSDVNYETGKMESKFSLQLLREKLSYKAPLEVDERLSNLNLEAESRKVIMKGPLKRKGSGPAESTDLQIFLLDHCLLIVKSKFVNNVERYKIYKKPIPLALLAITLPDQRSRRASSILNYGRPSLSNSVTSLNNIDAIAVAAAAAATSTGTSKGYPITFSYLGRSGLSPITLYAPSLPSRRQWLDMIQTQRQALTETQKVFDIQSIDARFFNAFNRVTCAASYGKSVVLGSDQGVYMKHERSKTENLRRLLPMEKVSQIDVLEQAGLILVLAEKGLYTYSLESLLAEDSAKRGRKLSSHVSFFKVGTVFQGTPSEKTLVCYVRVNTMQSTIRALEPHVSADMKSRSKLSKLIRGNGAGGGGEGLKVYKDLYIPGEASSLQYFKNILCVGSPKGFQMVDLVSAEVQSVLDPNDGSHQPLLHKENLKPISMFRHQNSSILLCYNELAFYIDKKGRRLRPEWSIRWEGQPTAFAVSYPYIVAFDTTFIEVRDINTGDLVQVIPGKNVRCLKPDTQDTTIYCAMDDPALGTELIFELIRT